MYKGSIECLIAFLVFVAVFSKFILYKLGFHHDGRCLAEPCVDDRPRPDEVLNAYPLQLILFFAPHVK